MKKYLIIFTFLFTIVSSTQITFGTGLVGYTPLAPINGLTDIETGTGDGASGLGFASYLRTLYIWGVSAASGLAVVMIMWGGVGYMTSAGGSGVEEAKKRISAALLGLMLALSSYIILSTINKSLLNLQFAIGKLDVSVEGNAEVKVIPRTSSFQSGSANTGGGGSGNTGGGSANTGGGGDDSLALPTAVTGSQGGSTLLLPPLN